jgi:hypothetical protein
MIYPNEPMGSSSLASWCRKLLRWCRSLELQPGVGYRVVKSSSGTVLQLFGLGGSNASGSNTTINAAQRYRVKVVFGSCVGCHTMNGTTEGPSIALAGVAVSDGGSGYTPLGGTKDLVIAGGTSATPAEITATIDGSGVITSAAVKTAGSYSVTPSNPATVDSGVATFNLTWSPQSLLKVGVHAAGTGYAVGDVLTVSGGTYATLATVVVTSITGGGSTGPIGTVAVVCPGSYTALPTTPNAVTDTGAGSSAEIDLLFGSPMVYIAKPNKIRSIHFGSWSEVIEGLSTTYVQSYRTLNADGQRSVSASGLVTYSEIVVPVWHVGDTVDSSDAEWSEIFSDTPTGGVGLNAEGTALVDPFGAAVTLMDQNRESRRWNQV